MREAFCDTLHVDSSLELGKFCYTCLQGYKTQYKRINTYIYTSLLLIKRLLACRIHHRWISCVNM